MVILKSMLTDNVNKTQSRILTIDFIKGLLVLLMVIYHTLNYLEYGSIPHQYMGFLPCSFIMITGFLVMQIYLTRYDFNFQRVGLRLGMRSLKLIFLFTFLNIAANMVWSISQYDAILNINIFFQNWFNVFILGGAKGVAFEVLIPISYTLFFAIFILKIQTVMPYFTIILAAIIFSLCAITDACGYPIFNLNMISSGIIGLALGMIKIGAIDKCATSWKILVFTLIIYSLIHALKIDNYVSQIIITCGSLIVFYSISIIMDSEMWWFNLICKLGRYSLISYIIQILYLQFTKNIKLASVGHHLNQTFLLIALISILTCGTVIIVDFGRKKNKAINKLYNVFFA